MQSECIGAEIKLGITFPIEIVGKLNANSYRIKCTYLPI